MAKKVLIIMNPCSGTKKANKYLTDIVNIFTVNDYVSTVLTTTKRGDGRIYAKNYAKKVDLIVCIGGDGTFNEVVSGVIQSGVRVPIGYIPAGSTNDFAEFHGISCDTVKTARKIVSGREHRVDVGRLGDKYFINAADFGAFTWLPYTTPQRLKNKMGFYAYVLDGIKDLAKLQSEHLRITINDQTQEGEFVFGVVASSSALAGALDFFGQKVVADDGLFEVLLIRRPNSPAELQSTIAALREQNLNNELISFCRTDRIEVECMKKLAWALDGEKYVGGSRHALEMLPRRVRIVY